MANPVTIKIRPKVIVGIKQVLKPFKIEIDYPTTIKLNLRRSSQIQWTNRQILVLKHCLDGGVCKWRYYDSCW